jgi:hypothetical protein
MLRNDADRPSMAEVLQQLQGLRADVLPTSAAVGSMQVNVMLVSTQDETSL